MCRPWHRTRKEHQGYRCRTGAVPEGMESIFWLCRGAFCPEGVRFLDKEATSMLSLEAVGKTWIPGACQARGDPRPGVEYGQVRAWPLATEPKSRPCLCISCELLCGARCARTVNQGSISTEPQRYVIRMPGGVGGGSREASPYPDWTPSYVYSINDFW